MSVSFPKPLSAKEEEHYISLYESGDEGAKDVLIERNLRLVAHIAKKYTGTGYPTDDLISIGTIGLIKAVSTYNSKKAVRLATYAARCIENPILSQMVFISAGRLTMSPCIEIHILVLLLQAFLFALKGILIYECIHQPYLHEH